MTENEGRHSAERGAAHVKDAYGKAQAAAGETTKVMQQTYSAASKGVADFNLHLIDIAQANMNAAFDFGRQLARVTSPTQFFELSTAYTRNQVERLSEQTRDITQLAQKVATEASQPLSGAGKTVGRSS
jgi:phasin